MYVVTHPVSAHVLMRGQLAAMKARGFRVTVIASPGPELDAVRTREGVATVGIEMRRAFEAPWRDAVALGRLVAAFRSLRPTIVNAATPKAGLLGMLAAVAAGVPVRMYSLFGLRLETARAPLRTVLGAAERLAAGAATRVVCVSQSLRDEFVRGGYAPAAKCTVLASGSANGVDCARFERTPALRAQAEAVRRALSIPDTAPIIGFIGRLVRDKGIGELLDAFAEVRRRHADARLLCVGKGFAGEDSQGTLTARLAQTPNAIIVDQVAEPAPYYAVMTVLAFPSHREGFPNVPLEAAAAAVPVVGFRSTGVVDAIVDGVTGTIVPKGDAGALAAALLGYLDEPARGHAHGAAGRARAVAEFGQERIWRAWIDEYLHLLDQRGLPAPPSACRVSAP